MAKPHDTEMIAGQTRLAAAIQEYFRIPCQRQHVNNWKNRNADFPAPRDSNRYDKAEVFSWVKENIIKGKTSTEGDKSLQILALEAEARTKIRNDEISAFEFEVLKGLWIRRDASNRRVIGALRVYHAWVKGAIERNATKHRYTKLLELGVSAHIATAFCKFDLEHARRIIDSIELKCAQAAKENTDGEGI